MKKKATERFTDRVASYILYRPDYPAAVTEYLRIKAGLDEDAQLADIGSGTGIFTKHLLDAGWQVFAVEPNDAMRHAADEMMAAYANYNSINGSATATTLATASVNAIVCVQAFHWFNNNATKQEFQRILQPDGLVALIWNNRIVAADAFSMEYDQLLKNLGSDYNEVNHQKLTYKDFEAFFKDGQYELATFPNEQVFDEVGLIGRAQSSSYVPAPDAPGGQQFFDALKAIFRKYQQDGKVRFQYNTEVFTGAI